MLSIFVIIPHQNNLLFLIGIIFSMMKVYHIWWQPFLQVMYFSYGILFGCGASLAYTPSLVNLNLLMTTGRSDEIGTNHIFYIKETWYIHFSIDLFEEKKTESRFMYCFHILLKKAPLSLNDGLHPASEGSAGLSHHGLVHWGKVLLNGGDQGGLSSVGTSVSMCL